MRHRHGPRKLNITDGAHRRAMMRHIGCALIRHEQITTTLPRAKELRRFIEPLITLGKTPSVHNRRLALARLQERQMVEKLFADLGVRFAPRPGGYVRILKKGFRKGDSAPMALVEFVDKAPEVAEEPAADAKQSKKSAKESAKAAKAASGAAETSAEDKAPSGEMKNQTADSAAESAAENSGAAEETKTMQETGEKQ